MAENQGYVALLEKQKDQIASFLPSYVRTDDERDRFFANARAVGQDYKLKDCTPQSLLNCVVDAAKAGLMIGGPEKHCAVVPFQTKGGATMAVLIVQWQGKSFLWQRAGAIIKLKAQVVYEGDDFALIEGDEDRIEHRPDFKADRTPAWLNDLNNIVGAYAIAWLPNGEKIHRFVSRSAIKRTMEAVKKKNNNSLGFGWSDWLPEMCAKTAIHRLTGLIQAQPKMTAEQKEAWQLNERIIGNDIETIAETPDDMPTAKGGEPRKVSGVVVVVPDKKIEAGPISDADQYEIIDVGFALGMNMSAIVGFLKKWSGGEKSDLGELTKSQLADFTKALAAEAGQ